MTDTLRRVELQAAPVAEQIADYLLNLLGPARPRRISQMFNPGELTRRRNKQGKWETVERGKYEDLARHAQLSTQMLEQHAAGTATYAATLDQDDHSRAGVIEVDQGGRAAVMRVLQAAEKRGLTCYAIAVDNPLSGHSGGHVWFPYTENTEKNRIVAQLASVVRAAGLPADTEIWPRAQVIRLPFGYHRWARTRGQLLSQAGEVLDLDSDLAAGVALVTSIRPNDAPPAIDPIVNHIDPIVSRAAAQNSDKMHSPIYRRSVAPDASTKRASPGEQAVERASLDDVKARFNAEHTLDQLLVDWGAAQTRDGYTCPCGMPHSHPTTLYISRQGKLFSYSPRCKLHTTKGWDAFGFYVLIAHNNNVTSALRELNPITPRRQGPPLIEPQIYRTQAQQADADRKRAQRRQQAADLIADVRARAEQDAELTQADRGTLEALLTIAGERGWARPSKERIAELSRYSLGAVKRSLMKLEKRGYFVSEGVGGGKKLTAIRTFLRGSFSREMIHESYIASTDSPIACEGGASPQAESVYPATQPAARMALVAQLEAMSDAELGAWMAWMAATYGDVQPRATPKTDAPESATLHNATPKKDAAELLTLNAEQGEPRAVEQVFADVPKSKLPAGWSLRRSGPFLYASDGPRSTKPGRDASAVCAVAWSLVEQDIPCAYISGFVQNSSLKSAATPQAADNVNYPTYDLALDWSAGGRLDLSTWRDPREMRVIDAPIADAPAQLELPEAEPQILCPPVGIRERNTYFALRGKARKSTNEKQRYALNRQADELMAWLPASDALAARRMEAPRSQAPGRRPGGPLVSNRH